MNITHFQKKLHVPKMAKMTRIAKTFMIAVVSRLPSQTDAGQT